MQTHTNSRRTNRVYKSLHKPLTYLGVERTLFFFVCVAAVGAFNLFNSLVAGLSGLWIRLHRVVAQLRDEAGLRNVEMATSFERYAKLGRKHLARTGNTAREIWKMMEFEQREDPYNLSAEMYENCTSK